MNKTLTGGSTQGCSYTMTITTDHRLERRGKGVCLQDDRRFFLYAHCKQSTNATVVGRCACGQTDAPTTDNDWLAYHPIIPMYIHVCTAPSDRARLSTHKKKYQRKGSARGFTVVHVIQAQGCTSRNFFVPLSRNWRDSTSLELKVRLVLYP